VQIFAVWYVTLTLNKKNTYDFKYLTIVRFSLVRMTSSSKLIEVTAKTVKLEHCALFLNIDQSLLNYNLACLFSDFATVVEMVYW